MAGGIGENLCYLVSLVSLRKDIFILLLSLLRLKHVAYQHIECNVLLAPRPFTYNHIDSFFYPIVLTIFFYKYAFFPLILQPRRQLLFIAARLLVQPLVFVYVEFLFWCG